MNINDIFLRDPKKRTVGDITRIYHGLENCCRCGCGGKYFDKGSVGFTRSINTMKKSGFKPLDEGTPMYAKYGKCISRGVEYGPNYIDIPYDGDRDMCYCFYFD